MPYFGLNLSPVVDFDGWEEGGGAKGDGKLSGSFPYKFQTR